MSQNLALTWRTEDEREAVSDGITYSGGEVNTVINEGEGRAACDVLPLSPGGSACK